MITLMDGTVIARIGDLYVCPKCGDEIEVYMSFVECTNKQCGFKQARKIKAE